MFRSYLKIALRTLWKHKTHSFINVVGLSVAFATCLLLFLTAAYQFSFDRFHQKADRIYQLYYTSTNRDGAEEKNGSMQYPLTPALRAEFPEITGITRVKGGGGGIRYGSQTFAKSVKAVDADYLTMFTFPMVKGNAKTALGDLNNVVISQNIAGDIFGKADPMGKTLLINQDGTWRNFVVTGVISDFPENSTEQYDMLVRSEVGPNYAAVKDQWGASDHSVYVELAENADPATVEKRFEAFVKKYQGGNLIEREKQGYAKNSRGQQLSLLLLPLPEVHFTTDMENGNGISKAYMYALILIGLFILAIACINFVNLTIAQAVTRAREVGVRKSLGAGQRQLFAQIWGETGLLCFVSLLLGLALAYGLLPQFNKLFRANISLQNFLTPQALLATGLGFVLVTLLAGGYPSWFVTRFNVVQVLKGKIKLGKPGLLRNSLIVTQFTIACLLIGCTLVMVQQLKYLREKPLGLNQEQVISLPVRMDTDGNTMLRQMRNQLANQPNILAITGTGVNVGSGLDGSSSRHMYGFDYNKRPVLCDWLRVDFDYLKTLDIKLRQGRDFSPQFGTDTASSVIVSESFAKMMGEKNPIGKFILPDSAKGQCQIIGVVADFNLYSLREKAEPIVMHINPEKALRYVFVRVTPNNLPGAMESVKTAWQKLNPKGEFQGSFLNENTERWYRREQRLSSIFTTAAGIAVLLSCMGLFAVALISIEQRTKEIGVRKVLGASVGSIVALISSDFLKLVGISIVLATPVGWWAMSRWLSDYAYKIDMPWWVFGLTGLLAILIAFATIAYQSIRAALMNPVKSLRAE